MNYYYISKADKKQAIVETGVTCNSDGFITVTTSLKDVDTYCHDILMAEEYSLFKVNLSFLEGRIAEYDSEEFHSELRRQVKTENIPPEKLYFIGTFPISMKNYYLEQLKHQYYFAKRADKFSIITDDGKRELKSTKELVQFYVDKYFIPEGIFHLTSTQIFNYLFDKRRICYYVALPGEVADIKAKGIFSPSPREGIIAVTASMEDANHIAADLLNVNKYGLFRIKDEGITGDLFNPGIDSIHSEHWFMLLQNHIRPEHIEYLGSHQVNNEFYLLETLKYEYITATYKGRHNFLDIKGEFRSHTPMELVEYYKESVFPQFGIYLSEGDILYYVKRYKPLEYVS